MRALPVTLVTIGALMSGCLSGSTDPEQSGAGVAAPVDAFASLQSLAADVPCEVDTVPEAETSENLYVLNTIEFDGSMHGEADVRWPLALVAAFQNGGFEILDLSDPANLTLLGTYEGDKGTAYDVKFTPDGTGAIEGNGDGVAIVDIRDPANPTLESFWEFPGTGFSQNAHMLYTTRIGDADWVFIAPNADRGVDILRIQGEPGARTLEFVGSWQPLVFGGGPLGPHDLWVTVDPDTETPLMYVANGFEGWYVADVSDPSSPELLGIHPNLDPHQGYVHTIQAAIVDGRRLVATIEEVGANALKVYDATNLQAPVLLGSWVNDLARSTQPQHNLQIVDGKLYVAHYAHGVFVFDLAAVPDAPLTGLYQLEPMALLVGPDPATTNPISFSGFWDVVVANGVVFANDISNGFSSVLFGCLPPGEAMMTSTG